ncbi:MAG: peptidase T [Sphingobacteriales bacterium]|nr:MAG: peptidase T [Sphingobacteriales bacterium]
MFNNYRFSVAERLLRYVQIDTQSDPYSESFPSTAKQLDLSRLLVKELMDMGISDAGLDEHGYVFATIPGNTDKDVPVICFCSHMDTAPDVSGTGVKPIVHSNYDGSPIILPDDPSQVLTIELHPYLKEKIGDDIITASGTTLLGADDKAGVAIIMDLAHFLLTHPDIKHGRIRILFTPDEEVGRGVEKLDMEKLGADYGYTLDGSEAGSFEDETFSADGCIVTFEGVSAHPGTAKGKMINAVKLAAAFVDALPKGAFSPETTEGREGFVHPLHISGSAEQAKVEFIIRDFETQKLNDHAAFLKQLAQEIADEYPGAKVSVDVKQQYRNMKEVLDLHPKVGAYAKEAIHRAGLTIRQHPVRGGTDGSRLSFMGLPCPNIFTGEMALHSRHEFVSVQDMQKSVETLVHLVQIWEENA